MVGTALLGTNGEAIAPWDPGFLGSAAHCSTGAPQRDGFSPNEDLGKPDKVFGISPERRLPETLKSCNAGRLMLGMLPEN